MRQVTNSISMVGKYLERISVVGRRPTGRRRPPGRRLLAVAAVAATAAALAGCGSSAATTTTTTTRNSGNNGGSLGGTGGTGGSRPQIPGASGTIAAINGTSLEVQNAQTGQTTVTYTSSTTFIQRVTASASAVTVGSCITARGTPTSGSSSSASTPFGGPVTATTVDISQSTSGSCATGFGGFGRGGGGGTGGTAPPGAPPGGGSLPEGGNGNGNFRPPNGSNRRSFGNFSFASGSVTAVNGSTITVSENNPRTNQASNVTVTVTSSTTYSQTQSARSSDLAVGKCATASGSSSSTGAITAQTINISTPGSNGCTSGFGGRGFGGPPGG